MIDWCSINQSISGSLKSSHLIMDHQKTVSNFDPSSPTAATESPNVNNDDPSKVTSPDYDDRNLIINYVPASMSQEELRLLFSQGKKWELM